MASDALISHKNVGAVRSKFELKALPGIHGRSKTQRIIGARPCELGSRLEEKRAALLSPPEQSGPNRPAGDDPTGGCWQG
jgi:hypothetical protein